MLPLVLIDDVSYEAGSQEYYLKLALLDALKGLGRTSPNPSVGCVIESQSHQIIASGYHSRAGQPHAEIEALNKISPVVLEDSQNWRLNADHSERLKGATIYVTLEPCAHKGRTPSCAATLAKLPIRKVVSILMDPNPLVSGKGFSLLQDKGITTECLEQIDPNHPLVKSAKRIHQSFLFFIKHKRPLISLKMASSIDGYIGLMNGESQWITGEGSRKLAREMRGVHDCIMTGRGTILVDNPHLNLRQTSFVGKPYPLFVWDSNLALLQQPELHIFQGRSHSEVALITTKTSHGLDPGRYRALDLPGYSGSLKEVAIWVLPDQTDMQLSALSSMLTQMGVQSVWLESGGKLASYFLKQNWIDQLYLFFGAKLLGGDQGVSWTRGVPIGSLNQAVSVQYDVVKQIESDLFISALLTY